MSLTKGSVNILLKKHLGIPNYEELLLKDKLEFLKLLVKTHCVHVYFQNVYMAGIPSEARHVPTVEEIVQRGCQGIGGNCFSLNYFMKILLIHLGYDAFSIAGSMAGTGTSGNHVMTVVRFSESEQYLIDVASGNPLFDPVPLNNLPFRGATAGDFMFEFRKISSTQYARFQVGGSLFHGAFKGSITEVPRFEFDLTPLEYEQYLPVMHEIWTNEAASPFYRNLFLFRYFYDTNENVSGKNFELNSLKDPKFILIYGHNLLIGQKDLREVKRFSSYADMLPVINKYFPKLDSNLLQDAMAFLEKHSQFEPRDMD